MKVVSRFFQQFIQWRNIAQQRQELMSLDDHMLKDIGLSRSDALREGSRIFYDTQTRKDMDLKRHHTRTDTLKRVSCVCFSPNGSSRLIGERILSGVGCRTVSLIDITHPLNRDKSRLNLDHKWLLEDLVLFVTPVYDGHLPDVVHESLEGIIGPGVPAILVVVYGNQTYGSAMIELRDLVVGNGFIPVAGANIVAEHSYSTAWQPIARGKPSLYDLREMQRFGEQVRSKVHLQGHSTRDRREICPALAACQAAPMTESVHRLHKIRQEKAIRTSTDPELCTGCGHCAQQCPMGAISPDDSSVVDPRKCLACFACIRHCPKNARQQQNGDFNTAIRSLAQDNGDSKPNEFFL